LEEKMDIRINGGRGGAIVFVILSCALAIGAFVPVLVNLALIGRFTWSLIPLGAMVMAWLIIAPVYFFRRHRALISWAAAAVSLPLFLWLVESLVAVRGWLLPLGLPVTALGLAAWGGIVWVWRYSRIRVWYSLALTLFLCTLVSLPIYFIVLPYMPQPDPVLWVRIIVFICMGGVSVLLAVVGLLVHGRKARKEKPSA
jgi:hypothetical protein